jgi:hypothetical protein
MQLQNLRQRIDNFLASNSYGESIYLAAIGKQALYAYPLESSAGDRF